MNSKLRTLSLLSLPLLTFLSGCGSYPTMSPPAVEMARALYTVCNQKREPALNLAAEKISSLRSDNSITEAELKYLNNIIDIASQGKWETAMLECRQMMEDQVPH